ncbi:LuxR C-terminal-related transcriptional regulator [Paenibacillus sp. strain BS8-2]
MVVPTKIQIPHVRQSLVARPGLLSKLNEGMNAKLTLVSAQAGYGKSTALSEWAKQCGAPVAWVSLDKQDNEWGPFWSCMVAAIRARIPSFGQSITDLLTQELDTSQETIMRALLYELISINGELVIVLDDYHVIELPLIHESLGYLLEYLPPHFHIYIASRSELAIPTARLLAKGELHRINRKDLKFDLAEGIVFFREFMHLSLTKEQVLELFHQTEGWVSGLQLAAIMLKRSDNIAESIRQFNGRQRDISDYLLEEVYEHLSSSLREFLLVTSVLGRMNQALCQAVTEQTDSQNQLEKLERMNLFIIPLDEERRWFRYHHLLSEFLQQIAVRENPSLWRQSHIRAATWYENEGFYEEAIEHYIKGELAEDAVRLIDLHYPELVYTKGNALLRWLSSLPKSSYEDKPMFELFYISKLLMNGEWQQAKRRTDQAEHVFKALRDNMPETEWKQRMSDLYFFRGTLASLQHDLARASHNFERIDFYSPEGSMFQHIGSKKYDGHDQFMSLLSLVKDPHGAEKFLLRWIKAWEKKPNYPFIGYKYVSYCMLMYEWNRLDEAELYLRQAMSREDLRANVKIWMDLGLVHAWLQHVEGRGSQAIEWLTHLGSTIESPDRHLIMQRIEAVKARLFLSQGQDERAFMWLAQCGLSHEDEVSLRSLEEHSILVRVLAANGQMAESLHLLENLEVLVNNTNRVRDRIKLLILQSMVLRQSNRPESTAVAPLLSALRLSEPAGYVRSFIDEGPPMVEMLLELLRERQNAATSGVSQGYIKKLLEAAGDSRAYASLPRVVLTEQETRVLLLFAEGLLYKEIAHQLEVTIDTVKFHVKNIYRKLGVRTRTQAVQRAKQLRIHD